MIISVSGQVDSAGLSGYLVFMEFNWSLLLTALGLALVLEGVPYFIFAEKMPRYLELLSRQPPSTLRIMALMAMVCGAGLVWLAG